MTPIGQTWYVKENDLIGGWSILVEDAPPSKASPAATVADCMPEDVARHIALLHNAWLESTGE